MRPPVLLPLAPPPLQRAVLGPRGPAADAGDGPGGAGVGVDDLLLLGDSEAGAVAGQGGPAGQGALEAHVAVARRARGLGGRGLAFVVALRGGGSGAPFPFASPPAGERGSVDVVGRGPASDVVLFVVVLPASAKAASTEIVVVKGRRVVVVRGSSSSSSSSNSASFARARARSTSSAAAVVVFGGRAAAACVVAAGGRLAVLVVVFAAKPFAAAPVAPPAGGTRAGADPAAPPRHLPEERPHGPGVAVPLASGQGRHPVAAALPGSQARARPHRAVLVGGIRVGDEGGAGRGEARADGGLGGAVAAVVKGAAAAAAEVGRGERRHGLLEREPPARGELHALVGAELRGAVEGPGVVVAVVGVVVVCSAEVGPRPRPSLLVVGLLLHLLLLLVIGLILHLLLVVVHLLLLMLLRPLLLVVKLVVHHLLLLLLRRRRERHQRDAKGPAPGLAPRASRAPEEGGRGAALGGCRGEAGAVGGWCVCVVAWVARSPSFELEKRG